MFVYEWLGDGLHGLADDLLEAFKTPEMTKLLVDSLEREIIEAFEDYWTAHSGEYDPPELTYYEFLAYIPMEFRMLKMEYGKILYRAMKDHGQVSLINLTLLCPDDTIIATYKTKQP